MKSAVVWIDRDIGKVYFYSEEKLERISVRGANSETTVDKSNLKKEPNFFEDIISQLQTHQKIILCGPGIAKYQFRNYLNEHHPAISRKVVGSETIDVPTDDAIRKLRDKLIGLKKLVSAS